MEPWQERVVEEKKELDEKIDKLHVFIKSNPKYLSDAEWSDLVKQEELMIDYSEILSNRILRFK